MFIMIQYKCMCISISYKICFPLSVKLSTGFLIRVGDELKSHPFSVHFSDLFLSKKD